MAGLLVLAHENICQISGRGPVCRPQVKGLHECLFPSFVVMSDSSSSSFTGLGPSFHFRYKFMLLKCILIKK